MIYFIADTHFYHNNIIKYCNRPFKDVLEMNETIINNWNNTVIDNDTIYHLGDVALCSNELLAPIINRLNGKKILIRGNHDTRSVVAFEKMGFTVLRNAPISIDKYKLILSHIPLPDTMIPNGYINIHGHIHNKPLNESKHKGGKVEYKKELYTPNKHICVSVDVINFTPISLEKILLLRKNI